MMPRSTELSQGQQELGTIPVITGLPESKAASTSAWLDHVLTRLPVGRVAVFGDFCLDAYWLMDEQQAEKSLETGLPIRKVRQQRYSLGGAGNVVSNLVGLGIAKVAVIGMVGADVFGEEMRRQLASMAVDPAGLYRDQADWQTAVYAKPCWDLRENNRIDFGAFNTLQPAAIDWLIASLERQAAVCDVVVLNQQIPQGVSSPTVIARINALIKRNPQTRFIVDSRDHAPLYEGAMLKLNAHEAARVAGTPWEYDTPIPVEEAQEFTRTIWRRNGQPVFLTRGEHGLVVADSAGVHIIPGIQILGAIDPVGAGDTVVAALAAALACKTDVVTSAAFANLAASVTVRKVQATGTASPAELRAAGTDPDYIYLPELADNPRRARHLDGSDIEIVRDLPADLNLRHAIFDHDGTLSVLREGWEQIMEPMMVKAILGPRVADADDVLYQRAVDAARVFIDKTTGIQTLVQMKGLAALVRQFRCVPEQDILDEFGSKRLYNEQLLETVGRRIKKLAAGELSPADFAIKNAHLFLRQLHRAGIILYLASGTDQTDVVAEAVAMGYADLFEGRIYGSIGDINHDAKKEVLERIIRVHHLDGRHIVTFGDGPVEMRETHKHGGVSVGIASDEVRRFGHNAAKRTRLIRGGADVIVPDFSQLPQLLALLKIPYDHEFSS